MEKPNGYEYVVVGHCPLCKRMIVAPRVWTTKKYKCPQYHTCSCR